jgi:hypothetical protein
MKSDIARLDPLTLLSSQEEIRKRRFWLVRKTMNYL